MFRRLKIAHLTSVHSAFDNRILHKECQSLAKVGYEVVLIAPHDRDTQIGNVRVRAVPRPRGRFARITRTTRQVYQAAVRENADVYHFHDPELIPIGLLLKLRGKRVIYDVHEDVPRQIAIKYWIAKPVRGLIARLAEAAEAVGSAVFDVVVAATPPIARRFPPRKTVTIHNFVVLEETKIPTSTPYALRENNIFYLGVLSIARGAQQMLEALMLLPETLRVRLILGGTFFPSSLEKQLQQMSSWQHTQYRGWLTREAVIQALCESRIGLSVLHPTQTYVDSYPTKIFEYMAAGIPVVVSDFPLWRQIVGGAECGLLVDPLDVKAIAGAIQWLLENPAEAEAMGKRGRAAVEQRYNWENEQQQLLEIYRKFSES